MARRFLMNEIITIKLDTKALKKGLILAGINGVLFLAGLIFQFEPMAAYLISTAVISGIIGGLVAVALTSD
jgi:hypothetical protein